MLNKLANLHKLCFPHKPWTAQDFADLKKSGCEIIASDNGFIVWRAVADEAEIITIGVNPESRGTGVATAMLHLMEQEIGSCKIFLDVASDNAAARALYEKNGYVQIAIRRGYYDGKTDAIIMEKKI